jgi:hypothetical protein
MNTKKSNIFLKMLRFSEPPVTESLLAEAAAQAGNQRPIVQKNEHKKSNLILKLLRFSEPPVAESLPAEAAAQGTTDQSLKKNEHKKKQHHLEVASFFRAPCHGIPACRSGSSGREPTTNRSKK